MENQQPNGKKAMEKELIRGRDMANQLLELFSLKSSTDKIGNEEGSKSLLTLVVEDLVGKIQGSFTNTLLLLNSYNHVCDEVVEGVVTSTTLSASCTKMETMGESRNTLNTTNRRGCYKRKSIAPTWERDSSVQTEDGHGWRKYGQKRTSNAKYLRSYYRCTHKDDQGCQAIKQVQRIQDEPPLYRTTYYGHHTCKTSLYHEMLVEPISPSSSSVLLSFDNCLQSKQEHPFSSSLLASIKHEPIEVLHHHHIAQNQSSSSEEDHPLCDYGIYFDYSSHASMLSFTESVEVDNVYEQFGFW